jgi:hypothetical protein
LNQIHKNIPFESNEEIGEDIGKDGKTMKRSANSEDETIVVVKKRGNKVFIEI